MFLILINNTSRAQAAKISYPHEAQATETAPGVTAPVALAPRGTALYEVSLPEALAKRVALRPFSVRTQVEGACRVFLVCATPALDRFSIDHR